MRYTAEISRRNPTCYVFLVDQSGSMADPFAGAPAGTSKAQGVADAINSLLLNFVLATTTGTGLANRFYISVIGYGNFVGPILQGPLADRMLVPIGELGHHPLRVVESKEKVRTPSGGTAEKTVRKPIWIEPHAEGKTPMCRALERAGEVVSEFIADHPGCYPPTVINVTDGRSSDGDPIGAATGLRLHFSTDGNVLLFNIHVSVKTGERQLYPVRLPDNADPFTVSLFEMSSPLPAHAIAVAKRLLSIEDGARGFAFNADMTSLVQFLTIGTMSSST